MAPYLTAANAKLRDERLADLSATSIDARIAAFEEIAESYRGVAFTPRSATVTVPGHCAGTNLILPHAMVSTPAAVSIDGLAFTPDQLTDLQTWGERGVLSRAAGWWGIEVAATYVHGYTTPPPSILDACTEYVLCVSRARASGVSRNTLSEATDAGTTRYSTPDWGAGRPTGFLEVDRLLNSTPDYRVPALA